MRNTPFMLSLPASLYMSAAVLGSWKRTTPLWTADVYSALPDEVPRLFPDLVDLAASRGAGVPYMGATGRLQFLPMPTTPSANDDASRAWSGSDSQGVSMSKPSSSPRARSSRSK